MLLGCTDCGKKYMWRSDPGRAPSTCKKCGGALKAEESAPERPDEGRLRDLEAREASLKDALARMEGELAAAKSSEASVREALTRQEGELAEVKAGMGRLEVLEADLSEAKESLRAAKEESRAAMEKKEADLSEAKEALRAAKEETRAALEKKDQEFDVERKRLTDLIQGFDRVEAANTTAMDEMRRELEAAHAAAEAADVVPELEEQIAGLRRELSSSQEAAARVGDLDQRVFEAGARNASLKEELDEAVRRADAAEQVPPGARVESARHLVGDLDRSLESIAMSLTGLKDRVARLSEALTAAESVPFPAPQPEAPAAEEIVPEEPAPQGVAEEPPPEDESRSWDDLVPPDATVEAEPAEAPDEAEAPPEDMPEAAQEVTEEVAFQEVADPSVEEAEASPAAEDEASHVEQGEESSVAKAEDPSAEEGEDPSGEKPGFFGKLFGKKK